MRRNGRLSVILSTPLSQIEEERADSEDGASNPRHSIASALKRRSTM